MHLEQGDTAVVTGAFGYSGLHITRLLLEAGVRVRSLTGHPDRADPFDGRVEVLPMDFGRPAGLRQALRGAMVLFNTYWVRFPRGRKTHDQAVENSRALFAAAAAAGVGRVVHTSIANASEDSPLSYYRGKAAVERALAESGLSHAILRPTVLFGGRDVLINNIAWLLRRFPCFLVAGDGEYRVQPVHVGDFARLAVGAAREEGDVAMDAVGPEIFSFEGLVRRVARALGKRVWVLHAPPALVHLAGWALRPLVRDVLLTRPEIRGLMAGLLVSHDPPLGGTALSAWLDEHAGTVGQEYASELRRHYK